MKKIAIILAGCGVYDGSEIQESVLALLAVERRNAQALCFAPDVAQADVVNHLSGQPDTGARNALAEAARITRGAVKPLSQAKAADFDALIIPGGFGVAKNLCSFAAKGKDCAVLPELEALIKELYAAKKPMGFACIAPVIAAKVLGKEGITLTVGSDQSDTAEAIRAMGAHTKARNADQSWADTAHKIVSTPAYMEAKGITPVYLGIETMVHEVLALIG